MKKLKKITPEDITYELIPYCVLWASILSALQACTDNIELENLAYSLKVVLPPLAGCVKAMFDAEKDRIDEVTQADIPIDGPMMLTAVFTEGDGNCLCRALSKAYFNTEERHIELRIWIIIEAIVNKKFYLSDDYLERGATCTHCNADLPTVFTTFSEFYTPGQKITPDTISCIYSLEVFSCAKMNSYMGIWQLAQSASVLGVPIYTIYPVCGECTIRNDFHRMFFPVNYPTSADEEPLVIMWTGLRCGTVPIHFVPLLENSQ